MNRLTPLLQAGILLTCLSLGLGGCGGEPFTYEPYNELKPGPGLFSGKDGEFNLIGGPKEEVEEKKKEEQEKSSPSE